MTSLLHLSERTRPTGSPGRTAVTIATINAVLLLGAAVLLRTWQLGNIPGVNGDEAWTGFQALRLSAGEPISWRTPTGNPVNWFLLLPMAALHALAQPSFGLLRITPLASGLAALAANYILCRKAFDRRTAAISTLLLSLMPINIAYSRFAWDASQSLLATLFVLYLPLIQCRRRGKPGWPGIGALAALGAAVLVHPTNVFASILLFAGPIWTARDQLAARLRNVVVPARASVLAAGALLSACVAYAGWQWIVRGQLPLHGPAELAPFLANYVHLLSGSTVYEYISGAGLPTVSMAGWSRGTVAIGDLLFAALAAGCGFGMVRRLTTSPTACDTVAVVGWLAMLGAFFLIAGPGAVAAHFERYGICLIAPAALVMSRGLGWWLETPWPGRRRLGMVMAASAWLWPAGFYLNYFAYFRETGGTSHVAFRTAAVEPKLEALRFVLDSTKSSAGVRIVCSQWWTYWPARYLAFDDRGVEVLTWQDWRQVVANDGPVAASETWFIEFADAPFREAEVGRYQAEGLIMPRNTILDYAGRPLIVVLGPPEKVWQNN